MSDVARIHDAAFVTMAENKSIVVPDYNYTVLKARNAPISDWMMGAHALFVSIRDAAEWADENSGPAGVTYHVLQYSSQGFFIETTAYRISEGE
jgi:hypothetical protein